VLPPALFLKELPHGLCEPDSFWIVWLAEDAKYLARISNCERPDFVALGLRQFSVA
jgi:hypothetical protein